MNDLPKVPLNYAHERSYVTNTQYPGCTNALGKPISADNFGGLILQTNNGTVASGASGSIQYTISFIPQYGPYPEAEMNLQQQRQNIDLASEIRTLNRKA